METINVRTIITKVRGVEMSFYKSYRLVEDAQGYTLEIFLNSESEEFSSEFLENVKEHAVQLDEQINKLIHDKFSNVKLNSVKLIIGSMVVGTLTLLPGANTLAATTSTTAPFTTTISIDTTATVTASSLNMRSGPSTTYSIVHVLWQGNVVKIIAESNGWYQISLSDGRTGWSSGQYLSLSNPDALRQGEVAAVIDFSKSFLGTPYVYGGASPSDGGFDCSGFTKYVYGQYGFTLNRISRDQALNGVYVAKENLQPGDLVFYSFDANGIISHVGIYLGGGKMINSPKTGDVVKISDVSTSYWTSRYVTARRIIQ